MVFLGSFSAATVISSATRFSSKRACTSGMRPRSTCSMPCKRRPAPPAAACAGFGEAPSAGGPGSGATFSAARASRPPAARSTTATKEMIGGREARQRLFAVGSRDIQPALYFGLLRGGQRQRELPQLPAYVLRDSHLELLAGT